jgi:hypothetical protein
MVVDVQGMMLTLTRVKQVNANSVYDEMVANLSVSNGVEVYAPAFVMA